jgi:hypothetical protein
VSLFAIRDLTPTAFNNLGYTEGIGGLPPKEYMNRDKFREAAYGFLGQVTLPDAGKNKLVFVGGTVIPPGDRGDFGMGEEKGEFIASVTASAKTLEMYCRDSSSSVCLAHVDEKGKLTVYDSGEKHMPGKYHVVNYLAFTVGP